MDGFTAQFIMNAQYAVAEVIRSKHKSEDNSPLMVLHTVLPYQANDSNPQQGEVKENNKSEHPSDFPWIPVQQVRSGLSVTQYFGGSQEGQREEKVEQISQKWEYVPFNFVQQERLAMLEKSLADIFGASYTVEQLLDDCKHNRINITDIKRAYKGIPGTPNSNSLVLFSGCKSSDLSQEVITPDHLKNMFSCRQDAIRIPCGCLYTGDYEASKRKSWDELNGALSKYYDFIGCLQIPHHGSFYNFNNKFLSLNKCNIYFASAGVHNAYRHPHSSVIGRIILGGKIPLVIKDEENSRAEFLIQIN